MLASVSTVMMSKSYLHFLESLPVPRTTEICHRMLLWHHFSVPLELSFCWQFSKLSSCGKTEPNNAFCWFADVELRKGSLSYSDTRRKNATGEAAMLGYKTTQSSTNPCSFQKILQSHIPPLKAFWFTTEFISGFGPRCAILRCLQRRVKNNTRLTPIPTEQISSCISSDYYNFKKPHSFHTGQNVYSNLSSVRQVMDVNLRTRVSTKRPFSRLSGNPG